MDVLIINQTKRRRYTIWHFLFDLVMVVATGGIWLGYILMREWVNR